MYGDPLLKSTWNGNIRYMEWVHTFNLFFLNPIPTIHLLVDFSLSNHVWDFSFSRLEEFQNSRHKLGSFTLDHMVLQITHWGSYYDICQG